MSAPPKKKPVFPSLLAELRSLAALGGSVVGATYARAAGSLLLELERIEDLRAERRYRKRSQAEPASNAAVTSLAARPKPSLPSTKGA